MSWDFSDELQNRDRGSQEQNLRYIQIGQGYTAAYNRCWKIWLNSKWGFFTRVKFTPFLVRFFVFWFVLFKCEECRRRGDKITLSIKIMKFGDFFVNLYNFQLIVRQNNKIRHFFAICDKNIGRGQTNPNARSSRRVLWKYSKHNNIQHVGEPNFKSNFLVLTHVFEFVFISENIKLCIVLFCFNVW